MNATTTALQLSVWTDAAKALEDQLADEHLLSINERNLLKSDLAACQQKVRKYELALEHEETQREIKNLKAEMKAEAREKIPALRKEADKSLGKLERLTKS